ncbi:MAG: hypothetical protein IE923_16415 [Micrococcales bacterium]|nr:hypothetical protein [Micrococcales bacterium]
MGGLLVLLGLVVAGVAVTWMRAAFGHAVDTGAESLVASARTRRGAVFWIVPDAVGAEQVAAGVRADLPVGDGPGVVVEVRDRGAVPAVRVSAPPGADVAALRARCLRAARRVDPRSDLRL